MSNSTLIDLWTFTLTLRELYTSENSISMVTEQENQSRRRKQTTEHFTYFV